MAQGIKGYPNQYEAGLDFDYSVWTAGTIVDLVNVPWNNDYRDVVRFADRNALNAYLDDRASSGIKIEDMQYAKPGKDIYLGIPYNRVNRYNYLRARNPLMPIEGDMQKDFYYFILECEYVNPQTTRIRVQLDVWQTYVYDVQFGSCYVQRGHIGIANEKSFTNFGRDYLTVPEGLDIGGEYLSIPFSHLPIPPDGVIAFSTVDLDADPGTVDNPKLNSAKGSRLFANTSDGLNPKIASGASVYYWRSANQFKQFMEAFSDKPWVTQGIIGAYAVPALWMFADIPTTSTSTTYFGINLDTVKFKPTFNRMTDYWRFSQKMLDVIPVRYQGLKKFFTHPYMGIEITTWAGKPIALKPESWQDQHATLIIRGSVGTGSQRIEFSPYNYNGVVDDGQLLNVADAYQPMPYYKGGDYFDIATMISDFPSLPIVNNAAISYLASNKNSIAFQYQNADWSQQRALAGAQAGYDIASGGLQTSIREAAIAQQTNAMNTGNTNRTIAAQGLVNAAASAASGIGGAMTPGGAGGSLVSGFANAAAIGTNAGIQTAANDESLSIQNRAVNDRLVNSNTQAQLMRDTNMNLAQFAARGDYANEIAGINAKVQDAKMIQPTTSGQIGGEATAGLNGSQAVSMVLKLLTPAAMRVVGDYWLRFGYAINAFINIPQDLHVMDKFSYWKMTQTYIKAANIPEGHKQAIRGILEKGFTNWKNPDDIGMIDIADNKAIAGVSY